MSWTRTLSVCVAAGLLAASCGSEDDPVSAPETAAVTEIDADTTEPEAASTSAAPTSDAATDTTTAAPAEVATTTRSTEPETSEDLTVTELIDAGAIDLTIDVPEGGVSGELLRLTLVNTTDTGLETALPCGLVFSPESDVQRMMSVTPLDVSLGAAESIDLVPYVMCIDSSSPAPESGATYRLAGLADDDLLALADCICDEDLLSEVDPAVGDMSLQIAVWATADGELPDLDAAVSETDGALSDVLGQEGVDFDEITDLLESQGIDADLPDGFDLETMLGDAVAFFDEYLEGARSVLDRCGIDLES